MSLTVSTLNHFLLSFNCISMIVFCSNFSSLIKHQSSLSQLSFLQIFPVRSQILFKSSISRIPSLVASEAKDLNASNIGLYPVHLQVLLPNESSISDFFNFAFPSVKLK